MTHHTAAARRRSMIWATGRGQLITVLANIITSTDRFAQDPGGMLYRYEGGLYRPGGDRYVRQQVKALLDEANLSARWSSFVAKEVFRYVVVDAPELWERPPIDVINVRNGLLEVKTGELKPHSPEYLSPVQLPVAYEPSAKCPTWDKFVADVFPKDAQTLAFEIPAWLMVPETSIQKAVLLLGEGANGKSTYLTAVEAFLGRTNVSAVSLHKLESDRFSAARLVGKLANICSDLPSEHLAGTSVFKAITGGDTITGERKYHDSFEFRPYARLIFSANHPPQSADASHAFFRRWVTVPFPTTFEESEQISRAVMDARLAAPGELSGVLNRALAALKGLRKRGRFTETESMRAAWHEFQTTTDPLAAWLDTATHEAPDAMVTKRQLLEAYSAVARFNGNPPMTETAIGRAVKRLRPSIRDGQRTVVGKRQWVWLGLGLEGG